MFYDDKEGLCHGIYYLHLCVSIFFPKGMGIVYEAEIIHFGHKRQPSFLTAALFQPLFSEQNFSSQIAGQRNILFQKATSPFLVKNGLGLG